MYKLVKRLKFFQQYSEDICLKFLDNSEYVFFAPGELIFKEGDYADSMFIILEGSVNVRKENNVSVVINSRYDGETIGEYAVARSIVDENESKRSATCYAGESTHMLKISAKKYFESLSSIDETKILVFLKAMSLFEHISPIDLALLSNSVFKLKFTFEQTILDYGQIPEGLYIIFQGTVKALYKKKEIEYPPKFFFGQRRLVGETTPSKCKILSNAANTFILLIIPAHLDLIFLPLREVVLALLKKNLENDL